MLFRETGKGGKNIPKESGVKVPAVEMPLSRSVQEVLRRPEVEGVASKSFPRSGFQATVSQDAASPEKTEGNFMAAKGKNVLEAVDSARGPSVLFLPPLPQQ